MSTPKFSILMPVVKTRYFKEAFESVLGQTCCDFEVIVLANGSDQPVDWTENSKGSVRYYKNISQLPMVENWNRALSYSQGEYVLLMSDDDIMEPDFLAEVNRVLSENNEVGLVHVRTRIIDETGKPIRTTGELPAWEDYKNFVDSRLLKNREQFISDFVFRREPLVASGGFVNLPCGWDADVQTSFLAARNNGCHHINRVLFNYRVSSVNVSNQYTGLGRLDGALQAKQFFLSRILSESVLQNSSFIRKWRYAGYYSRLVADEIFKLHTAGVWARREAALNALLMAGPSSALHFVKQLVRK